MRGIDQREFEGKDFPHALGEHTRGPVPLWSEHASDEIPPQLHQVIKGLALTADPFCFPVIIYQPRIIVLTPLQILMGK